ncbi:MAG: heat-inducible transcriptional repressor HrcA, partial [Microbacterium sp.]|nr:heat-inducible transcriptional repressor HrcA [Microbacterium sp.]
LVGLGGGRLLAILVTDTGRVSQRMVPTAEDLDDADVAQLRARIAAMLTGRSVRDGAQAIAAQLDADDTPAGRLDQIARPLLRVIAEELEEFRQDRLLMAGTANLARREADFRGSIYPLLEAIEEQVTLLRLMSEMIPDDGGLAASIGRENEPFGLAEASVLASDYDATGSRARVGVLGPTRMDYPTNLAAVRAVAHYLSRLLEDDDSSR